MQRGIEQPNLRNAGEPAQDQQPTTPVSSVSSPAPSQSVNPLCTTPITPAGRLEAINEFLRHVAATPDGLAESQAITQELIGAAMEKFLLLREGRHWDLGMSPETEAHIRKYYPDVDSFMAHQKHLAFPRHVTRYGELLPSQDITPLPSFSLAVLRHIASDAVEAIDLTPFELPAVHCGEAGLYSVISFGAELGILNRLHALVAPTTRLLTLIHDGAHHLLFSLAYDQARSPQWLKNTLVEPPKRLWGVGEVLKNNHATLYGEVLANYIAREGDAAAAIRDTQRTYPRQWYNQFVGRFPCVKKLSPEKVIIGLQQLTELYPGSTWVDLQNMERQGGEISRLLS
ncbi:MAG: hypothetical protein ACK5GN_14915 [Pseudomonadota bacterium]|jgi:hypothetical protein